MKIMLVHNRYRSTAPSGENRVVDTRGGGAGRARARGHPVRAAQRRHRELVPGQEGGAARPGGVERRGAPRTWPPSCARTGPTWSTCITRSRCSARLSCTRAGTRGCRWWPPSTTTSWPAPAATSSATARSATTARAGCPARPSARLLPRLAGGHRPGGPGHDRAPPGLAVAGLGLHLHLGRPARPAQRAAPAPGPGLRPAQPHPAAGLPGGKPGRATVVYAGRLDEAKGVRAADGRLGPLPGQRPASRAAAGDRGRGPARRRGGRLGGEPALGRAGRAGRQRRLRRADVRRPRRPAPSAWEETFGLVVVEAMAAGRAARRRRPRLVHRADHRRRRRRAVPARRPGALGQAIADVDAHPERYETTATRPARPTSSGSTRTQPGATHRDLPLRDRKSRLMSLRAPVGAGWRAWSAGATIRAGVRRPRGVLVIAVARLAAA